MTYVVKIDNDFRDSLIETLDKNDRTGKVRPYYYGLPYREYIILIPLRSNCPRSYSLQIYNTGNRTRPGLDFCKMLILSRNEISQKTTRVAINNEVLDDLNRKRSQIRALANKTINEYRVMYAKIQAGKDLTSNERFLYQRSTLRNFLGVILNNG